MTVSLEEEKAIIKKFLQKSNAYAEERIKSYQQKLPHVSGEERLELQARIMRWTVYITFNEYPLKRLDSGELDGWLRDEDPCGAN